MKIMQKLVRYEKHLKEFRSRALTPNNPVTRGTAQNSDIYFQTREASNKFYNDIIPIVEEYMAKMEENDRKKLWIIQLLWSRRC